MAEFDFETVYMRWHGTLVLPPYSSHFARERYEDHISRDARADAARWKVYEAGCILQEELVRRSNGKGAKGGLLAATREAGELLMCAALLREEDAIVKDSEGAEELRYLADNVIKVVRSIGREYREKGPSVTVGEPFPDMGKE
jgi:hypothetical protein